MESTLKNTASVQEAFNALFFHMLLKKLHYLKPTLLTDSKKMDASIANKGESENIQSTNQ
jgi:hypothetical protein